ncbi:MAG TPA: hypothetical protein VEF04_05675 [Blastocatellia bacterium]|nr:hypothetical protein [Blastocatellia bacterium]
MLEAIFLLSILNAVLIIHIWRHFRREWISQEALKEVMITPGDVHRAARRREPYARSNGKRLPKINDDTAGWRKEHDV